MTTTNTNGKQKKNNPTTTSYYHHECKHATAATKLLPQINRKIFHF